MTRLLAITILSFTLAAPTVAQETQTPAPAPQTQEAKSEEDRRKEEARSPFFQVQNFFFRGKRSHAELRSSDVLRDGPNFSNRGTARMLDR